MFREAGNESGSEPIFREMKQYRRLLAPAICLLLLLLSFVFYAHVTANYEYARRVLRNQSVFTVAQVHAHALIEKADWREFADPITASRFNVLGEIQSEQENNPQPRSCSPRTLFLILICLAALLSRSFSKQSYPQTGPLLSFIQAILRNLYPVRAGPAL